MKGRLDEVEKLHQANPQRIHVTDGKGKSALHHAAKGGHINVLEFLLNKGAGM